MAYSMLGRLKHVKAHEKNCLKTADRTERGIFFREFMRLILGGYLPFPKPSAGVKNYLLDCPAKPRIKNLDTRVPIWDTQFLA
jgi:hypothetical protein